MPKRGQTTVEYLVILSVILILALAVMSVTTKTETGKNLGEGIIDTYWTTADIGILGLQANTTTVKIIAQNNLNTNITITNIYANYYKSNYNVTLRPGQQYTFYGNYSHSVVDQGRRYSITPSFTYVDYYGSTVTFYGQANIEGEVAQGSLT